MTRNVEIKARVRDFETQSQMASRLADKPAVSMSQEDTFFRGVSGRLKLREFGDGTGELIHYDREDCAAPTESRFVRSPCVAPASIKLALSNALGVRAVVKKKRTVFFSDRTRIHFDEVEGLGKFIELEVVLREDQSAAEGVATAEGLMNALGIREDDLVPVAYVDLLDG